MIKVAGSRFQAGPITDYLITDYCITDYHYLNRVCVYRIQY